jgi:hypothetical protein
LPPPDRNDSHGGDPVNPPATHISALIWGETIDCDLLASRHVAFHLETLFDEVLDTGLTGQYDGRILERLLRDPALALRLRDEATDLRLRIEGRILESIAQHQ